jgi:hypothetical protein
MSWGLSWWWGANVSGTAGLHLDPVAMWPAAPLAHRTVSPMSWGSAETKNGFVGRGLLCCAVHRSPEERTNGVIEQRG